MVEKLERQMNLLATLLATDRHLVASDIQRRVEGYPEDQVAYRRAFERDKDDLRRLGVPIDIARTETVDGPIDGYRVCLLYTSPSPRDATLSRMPSSA